MDTPADGLQQSPAAAEASAASPSPLETGGATSVNQFFVKNSRTKTATVTICDAPVGKKKKTSWVWQVVQEFAPPINNKNVRCIVMGLKNGVQKQCGALQRWVIEEAAMPHLALLARPYHGVETTNCQAERNVSALALLIGNMRSSMGAFQVEQMMFLRLNQKCIPEIAVYNRVIDRQQARRNQCREGTDKAQNEGAGDLIEIDL